MGWACDAAIDVVFGGVGIDLERLVAREGGGEAKRFGELHGESPRESRLTGGRDEASVYTKNGGTGCDRVCDITPCFMGQN